MLIGRTLGVAASLLIAGSLAGQAGGIPLEQAKLTASNGVAGSQFGGSVSLSGDTAVVGAYAGSNFASVFTRNGVNWTLQAELIAAATSPADCFGSSVAIDGNTVIIGAPQTGSGPGSAYVFVRNGTTWTEQAKLTASDAGTGDDFGSSVAVSGDTAVVGADAHAHASVYVGAAYVFVRNGTSWSQQAELLAMDGAAQDHFGYSVKLSEDTAVVTALGDDHSAGIDAGSAYIFNRLGTTWQQQAKLTASDAAPYFRFGSSVAMSENTVVVGAEPFSNAGGLKSGSAYAFVRSGVNWTEEAKLTALDAATGDSFGVSVAIQGNMALVGAYRDTTYGGPGTGSASIFIRNGATWTQQATLTSSDAAWLDGFGYSVSLSGCTAVVGAILDDNAGGVDAGSAYVFAFQPISTSSVAGVVRDVSTSTPLIGASVAVPDMAAVPTGPQGTYVINGVVTGSVTVTASAPGFNGESQTIDVAVGVASIVDFALTPTFSDIGHAMGGSLGPPSLVGEGTLEAGSAVALALTNAKPFSLAPLVVGLSNLSAPFKGGTMVPYPNYIFPAFTDFFGKSTFGGLWPAGVPSGFTTYFQWWIQDPAGTQGYAASNAVAGTAP